MKNLIDSDFIDTQNIDSICLFDAHYRSVCYGDSASTGPDDTGVHLTKLSMKSGS